MNNRKSAFDIDLLPGQFVVFLINSSGQFLRFSDGRFVLSRNPGEESVKVFDTYENAVDFAQSLTLPPAAKTWCLCDHRWECIKSGTGDEERESVLRTAKITIPKKAGIIPKVMSLFKRHR